MTTIARGKSLFALLNTLATLKPKEGVEVGTGTSVGAAESVLAGRTVGSKVEGSVVNVGVTTTVLLLAGSLRRAIRGE